jgi:hypothetical protein
MCRMRAHCVVRKKGWPFTSEAPARAPSRRFSSLIKSFRMRDLHRLFNVSRLALKKTQVVLTLIFEEIRSALGMAHHLSGCSQM